MGNLPVYWDRPHAMVFTSFLVQVARRICFPEFTLVISSFIHNPHFTSRQMYGQCARILGSPSFDGVYVISGTSGAQDLFSRVYLSHIFLYTQSSFYVEANVWSMCPYTGIALIRWCLRHFWYKWGAGFCLQSLL